MEDFHSDAQALGGAMKKATIQDCIRRIFAIIGENPNRDGLVKTPERVEKAMRELFRGYDPKQAPKITVFDNGKDGIVFDNMVVDSGNFYSFCEHHMLPFFGSYHFAYIPNPKGKILGISKVARVVDYCAARLQIQERLGKDICDMIAEALGNENPPLGIAIVLKGEHLCKSMRGVKKRGQMQTSHLSGIFKTNADARREFLSLANA
jgi:GTP cyclohydrolase I